MLATMCVGIGSASAATTYSALSAPTVGTDGDYTLGTVSIDIDTLGGDTSALLSLPADFEFDVTAEAVVDSNLGLVTALLTPDPVNLNEALLELSLGGADLDTDVKVLVKLPSTTVPAGAPDDITLDILGLGGQLSDGSVVVGHTGTGTVNVTAGSPPSITSAGTDNGKIILTLKESSVAAFANSAKSVKFTLPYGFEWDDTNYVAASLAGTDVVAASIDPADSRILLVDVTADDNSKSVARISMDIAVDELKAKYGDVDVRIAGDSDTNVSSLVIAKYVDFGVTASVDDPTEIIAGLMNQEVGDIVFTEGAPESAINGRSFTLTLPKGAKWADFNTKDGKGFDGTPSLLGDNGRTLKVIVVQGDSGTAGTFTLTDVYVDVAVDFAGPLTVAIEGKAGIDTDEVTIADVIAPITLTAAKTDVKIGLSNQLAGTLTITEVQAAVLMPGKDLLIVCSDDAVEIQSADVAVTSGDLVLGDEEDIDFDENVITIPIDGESREASTIVISNIMYKVDRTVVEGELKAKVQGTAVNEFADADKMVAITVAREALGIDMDTYDLFGATAAAAVNALVVTPAPGEEKNVSVFTFGSTNYTINGEAKTMVAAAFAENNRTYLPIRDIAYALGIDDNNIIWDQATQTVTLMQAGKVVQVKLGSNILTINSAPITMDVTVLAQYERTFLPASWVASAFGATATWDAAANSVTIAY